jgi:pimeloyl-ACP methyl ester carboxylesterase
LFRTACLAGLLSLAFFFADGQAEAQRADKGKAMQRVTSKDGTQIAYDKSGKGPALILVNGAFATRSSNSELAQLLANHFTVYSYDRRGRGDSADTKPYSVQREIEDIAALIDAAGGSAYVYGKSSGACLALEATSSLGDKVKKLAIYEAPYSEAEGAAKEWREFRSKLDGLLAADRRADAVTLFMKFVGAPDEAIAEMKASAAWPDMEAMAPTLAYDNAVVGDDRSVPVERAAKVKAVTLVMDGGASLEAMPFMRPTADKLAKVIPGAQRRTIEGQAHDVSAKALAPILVKFFDGR